jgi:hypothetical protein
MRAIVLVVLAGVVGLGDPDVPQSVDREIAVYRAVLSNTIQPEIDRLSAEAGLQIPAPVIVFNRTVSTCDSQTPRPERMGCLNENIFQPFERESRSRRPPLFDGLLTSDRRRELAGEFRAKNARAASFTGVNLVSVVVVEPETLAESIARESTRTRGFAAFSVPAFSSDGYALVYGTVSCDGQCGKGWLFLLKARGAEWQVLKAQMMRIS